MRTGLLYGGIALIVILGAGALLLVRRAGSQPDVGQDPGEIAARGMRARKQLLILIVLVLAAIGGVIGTFWPATHSGQPMNTATSRW